MEGGAHHEYRAALTTDHKEEGGLLGVGAEAIPLGQQDLYTTGEPIDEWITVRLEESRGGSVGDHDC